MLFIHFKSVLSITQRITQGLFSALEMHLLLLTEFCLMSAEAEML